MDLEFIIGDTVFLKVSELRELRKRILSHDCGPKEAASAYLKMRKLTKDINTMLVAYNEMRNNLAWNKNRNIYGK